MPNYFQLIRKTDGEPESLTVVDEQVCKLLGLPVHPTLYCRYWFDAIGFPIACGKTLEQVKANFNQDVANAKLAGVKDEYAEAMVKICDMFIEHYTTDAWAEIGKR